MAEKTDELADKRLDTMERIARRNANLEQLDEAREAKAEKPEATEEPAPEVPQEPVAEVPAEEPAAPVIQKHRLKVNGKEIELTTDELIARAQKVEAADQYLQEAAKTFKGQKQETPKAEPAAPSVEEDDAALARAIQTGTEEEARNAIKKLRATPSPAISQDEMLRIVDQRLAFQEAARKFQSEFKDVFEDPYLLQIAMNEDAKLLKEGDARGYWDRFQEVGTKVRQWRDSFKSQPDLAEKQQRKASVVTPITAAGRAGGKTEEKPETVQDTLREMAQARKGR